MKEKNTIDQYTSVFLELLKKKVKTGIGVKCVIYPAEKDGAVLEISLTPEIKDEVEYRPISDTVNDALQYVEQNLISGNLSNVKFSGTNISMQGNKIILIKGEDTAKEWGENAAIIDSIRIYQLSRGAQSGR